jgi:hypothetical protein
MSESHRELVIRRQMLVLRSERLRMNLGRTYGEFEARLGGFDKILGIARRIATPSILLSLGGLGLGMLRRTHPFRWATRGFLIFSVVRRILAAVRTLRASSPPPRR